MKVSVIIPCYRSTRTLRPLVTGLHRVLGDASTSGVSDYEVILVVDGSPDQTYAQARELERESARVSAVLLRRNYGQHNALVAGIARARHEVVVTMDDDLQHRASEIPALVRPLEDPLVDLVYGVPRTEEHGFWRSLASRTVKGSLAMAGVPNASDVSAFRAFRTGLREAFVGSTDSFVNLDVVLSWATVGVRRVEIEMDHRQEGESGYGFRRLVRHTLNMVTGYGTVPLRLVTWLGLVCGVLGLVLLVLTLYNFAVGRTTVSGFTTLASMIALFSGAQMLSVGILGEYVGRLHFRSMHRPTYLVRVDGGAGTAGAEPDDIARSMRERYEDGTRPAQGVEDFEQ